jgi:hypothetical protein
MFLGFRESKSILTNIVEYFYAAKLNYIGIF